MRGNQNLRQTQPKVARKSRLRQLQLLNNRWPTEQVLKLYHSLAPVLMEQAHGSQGLSKDLFSNIVEAYYSTMLPAILPLSDNMQFQDRSAANSNLVNEIEELSSLFGMVVHLVSKKVDNLQQFRARRRRTRLPTYPTPPVIGELLAEYIICQLLRGNPPSRCRSARQAEAAARRILDFRIVDTSVEAGHFLIQIVLATMRSVDLSLQILPSDRNRLYRALLNRLYRECLWGVDKNPLAVEATKYLLSVLGEAFGVPNCVAPNIICADSLNVFREGSLGSFDAVINNPPWGRSIDGNSRHTLRSYSSTRHHTESYVAFTENSVDILAPKGIFGFVLPSQMLGAFNARGLREYLADRCQIDELILLPRTAFAEATVRGIVLLGRKDLIQRQNKSISIMRFPLTYNLTKQKPPVSHKVRSSKIRQLRGGPWTKAILNADCATDFEAPVVRLGDLAKLLSGVRPYGIGKGSPKQSEDVVSERRFTSKRWRRGFVPACKGADINPFRICPATTFLKLGPWLAWTGPHQSLMGIDRVFMRELCRRDGSVFAAVAPADVLPLHSVITIIPLGIDALRLTAILNSSVISRYVRENTTSFSKVDFQRITLSELAEIPVPRSLVNARFRRKMGWEIPSAAAVKINKKIFAYARKISLRSGPSQSDTTTLFSKMEAVVKEIYKLEKDSQ